MKQLFTVLTSVCVKVLEGKKDFMIAKHYLCVKEWCIFLHLNTITFLIVRVCMCMYVCFACMSVLHVAALHQPVKVGQERRAPLKTMWTRHLELRYSCWGKRETQRQTREGGWGEREGRSRKARTRVREWVGGAECGGVKRTSDKGKKMKKK